MAEDESIISHSGLVCQPEQVNNVKFVRLDANGGPASGNLELMLIVASKLSLKGETYGFNTSL